MWSQKLLVALCASALLVESGASPATLAPAHLPQQRGEDGSDASAKPIPQDNVAVGRRAGLSLAPRQEPPPVDEPPVPADEQPAPAGNEPRPPGEEPPPDNGQPPPGNEAAPPSGNGQPAPVHEPPTPPENKPPPPAEDERPPEGEEPPPPGDNSDESLCHRIDVENLRDKEMSKMAWDESEAGVLADKYIDEHGLDYWVQDLDQEIFDEEGFISHGWDCRDWGDGCRVQRECPQYEKTKHGVAGYFLYYSLQQFYDYMKEWHRLLTENTIKNSIDVHGIMDDFAIKEEVEEVNPAIIVAGILTILAGLTVRVPGLVGGFTVLAGAATTVGNVEGEDKDNEGTDGGRPLADRVLAQFDVMSDYISSLNGAVFGIPGINPEESIPQEMQKQFFNNPSVRALADGQWLVADPLDGMKDVLDELYRRGRHGLVWTMMRTARRTFLFIDRDYDDNQAGCEEFGPGAMWYSEENICLRLLWVSHKTYVEPVEQALVDKMFGDPYKINKAEAYHNAYRCWVDNDGKLGDLDFEAEVEGGEVPPCYFAMVVKSGYWPYEQHRTNSLDPDVTLKLDSWMDQKKNNHPFDDESWDPVVDGM